MGTQFELIKYDMDKYLVFYIEPNISSVGSDSGRDDHIGFVVIELKDLALECPLCHRRTKSIQTWWHKQLPFSYIIGRERDFNIHLCLDCAASENNNNILLLKNNYTNEYDIDDRQELLHRYEIENEQIEYYKIYKKELEKELEKVSV